MIELKTFHQWILSDFCKCGAGEPDGEGEISVQANENCRHKQSRSVWDSSKVKDKK